MTKRWLCLNGGIVILAFSNIFFSEPILCRVKLNLMFYSVTHYLYIYILKSWSFMLLTSRRHHHTIHWELKKMPFFLQTYSNAFALMKVFSFWLDFRNAFSGGYDKSEIGINRLYGLKPNTWQAIAWTIAHHDLWCHMASFGHSESINLLHFDCEKNI